LQGLISGFVGWVLTKIFAKPFRRGLDIAAAEAQTSMVEYANLRSRYDPKDQPTGLSEDEEKRLGEAETRHRRLSALFPARQAR